MIVKRRRKQKLRTQLQPGEREKKFKFLSFSDQIARLSVDYASTSLAIPNQVYDRGTFFYEAITKWIDLDYGDDFKEFLEDINHEQLATYAQLLHHQEDIADALKCHLSMEESSALPAILEISIGFARDLREDFHKYFWDFFEVLMGLIQKRHSNVELVESAFRSLAVFFKLEWRELVKSLRKALFRMFPLFSFNVYFVRRFVAEAASFLLRKAANASKVVGFVVQKAHESNDEAIRDGVVQLLFNTIKGTKGQFHSRTPALLSDTLSAILALEPQSRETGVGIMEAVMIECVDHSSKESSVDVTNVILGCIEANTDNLMHMDSYFRLLHVWIVENDGRNFNEITRTFDLLNRLLTTDKFRLSSSFVALASRLITVFVFKTDTQDAIRNMIGHCCSKVDDIKSAKLLLGFFESIMDLHIFDVWGMECLGKLSSGLFATDVPSDMLDLFTDFYFSYVIKKHPLSLDPSVRPVPGFDVSHHRIFRNALLGVHDQSDAYYKSLFVLPWLYNKHEQCSVTAEKAGRLAKVAQGNSERDLFELWSLCNFLRVMDSVHLKHFSSANLMELLKTGPENELKLRVVDLCLEYSTDAETFLNQTENVENCIKLLKPVCAHHVSIVRKMALRVLKRFGRALNSNFEAVIDAMVEVENRSLTFETFRERSNMLRRLKVSLAECHIQPNVQNELCQLTFGFVLAQLFESFTLYWPQVVEVAVTFGDIISPDILWSVFCDTIQKSSSVIRDESLITPHRPLFEDTPELGSLSNKLLAELPSRADFWSFRLEVVKLLSHFPELAERKNRSLVPLMLDIYENEFQSVTATSKKYDNLTVGKYHDTEVVQEVENDVELDGEATDPEVEAGIHVKLDRKLVKNTVKNLLQIFAKFENLKSVFKGAELQMTLNELLRSDDTDIQKIAVQCLFGCKIKSLEPYRENFEALVVDKQFVDQLVHFTVDDQNSVVEPEHRSEVMPVLMRLLDGKMHTKVGRKGVSKRPAIFRFIAGCRPEELELFLRTIFWSVNDLVDETSLERTCSRLLDSYNPQKTISPQRISSVLECLADVYKKLGQTLSAPQHAYVYQIFIAIHLLIRLGLDHCDVTPHFKRILRIQRTKAFNLVPQFLNSFQKYEFSPAELNALFATVVEPYLVDSYRQSSTDLSSFAPPWALIRGLCSLSTMPRYFPLLSRPFSPKLGHRTTTTALVDTLFSDKTMRSNQTEIVEAMLNLLKATEEPEFTPLPALFDDALCTQNQDESYGTRLVSLHVTRLLAYLKAVLPSEIKSTSRATMANLALLEQISAFANDPKVGKDFSSTLLQFVELGHLRNEESLTCVLNSVAMFVKSDPNPEACLKQVTPFLSSLKPRKVRAALVRLLQSLHSNPNCSKPLQHHFKRLEQLELWDRNRINEVDYEARHQAIADLSAKLEEVTRKMSTVALRAYLHELVDEISMRSACSSGLKLLIEFVCKSTHLRPQEQKQLVTNDVIVLIQQLIRESNESVRHEGVSLLSLCVDLFAISDEFPVLVPLKQIRDTENKDLCFFENVAHLQIHRRQRAFNKLRLSLESDEVTFPLDVLERFVLPLARPYVLLIESKFSTLADEAIHLFAQIVKQQPWPRYLQTLNRYMNQVNKNDVKSKPIIRVLVAIVDAFHFDVRQVVLPKASFQLKRRRDVRKRLGAGLQNKASKNEKTADSDDVHEQPPNLVDLEQDEKLTEQQNILATLLRTVVPKLRQCIQPPTEFHAHKKAQNADNYHTDEEEIIRTPLALSTVKLLQKLPQWAMDMHLQGVILTMFKLLLSRSYIVRQAARKSMEQIIQVLGPKYLKDVIVHVMIFTVHSLINALQSTLKPGDLDDSLSEVFGVIKEQQFGALDDERQIQTIKANTPEAKSNRAFETFVLLGRFATIHSLPLLVDPMKQVIEDFPNATTQKKLSEMLKCLSAGLKRNASLDAHESLEFVSHTLSEHISQMCQQQDALRAGELKQKQERDSGYRPQNCLLLAPEPKRLGVIVKTSQKSKVAVFVEFGLQLLGDVIQEKRSDFEKGGQLNELDKFVGLVADALRLKYEKITAVALRALHSLFWFDLPAVEKEMPVLVDRLFILLAEYANASGTSKINVTELNSTLFKCFVTVVRKAPASLLNQKRLQILLNHIEMDVIDPHRQTTAFILAKAFIQRKLCDTKLPDLIQYFAEICITSPIELIREQSRSVIHLYLKVHPEGIASAEKWLRFFLDQIEYELVHGRLSALEMVHTIFEMFTDTITDKFGFPTFVKLVSRFEADDSDQVHRYVAACLKEVVASVSDSVRNDMYQACRDWLNASKSAVKLTGARALCEFVKTPEGKLNQKQVNELIASLGWAFTRKHTEQDEDDVDQCSEEDSELMEADTLYDSDINTAHALVQLFTDLLRTHLDVVKVSLTKNKKMQLDVMRICALLRTPSDKMQLSTSVLLEHLMCATQSIWPILQPHTDLTKLADALIFQLRNTKLDKKVAEEAVKNLATISSKLTVEQFDELCSKLAGVIRIELKKEQTIVKRISVFKFLAAQVVQHPPASLHFPAVTSHLLPYLFRELASKSGQPNENLQMVAGELASLVKERLGATLFSKLFGDYHSQASKKQNERRREKQEVKISNPELAVKRKQKVNQNKRSARKRKLDQLKPHRITKRKRQEEIKRTGEI